MNESSAARLSATIVVPCYNESNRLDLQEFHDFAAAQPTIDFLFVDDGSTDATAALIEPLTQQQPERFQLLQLAQNGGKAEAVRAGMLKALESSPSFVGFWDADLSTPLDELPRMLELFERLPQIEMVFGARVNLLGRSIKRKTMRHYLGRVFATVVSWLLELPIYDTQCGAKVFRTSEMLGQVLAEPFRSRWVFDVEIIARFSRLRYEAALPPVWSIIYELPLLKWHDVEGSKLRLRDFLTAAADLNSIYWKHIRGIKQLPSKSGS